MESQLTTHNRQVETEILARQGLRLPPISFSNLLSTRNRIEVCVCISGLLFEPCPCSRRVLIFEPAIGICDLYAV